MRGNENLHWEIEEIAQAYKAENPKWIWSKCLNRAKIIYKELNKLNRREFRNREKYYKFNTPFSFYFDKDNEFSSIHEARNE